MREKKVMPLLLDSYLAIIRNSVGSGMFRSFYAAVDGEKQDITQGGVLSCAFFVSSVLTLFGLIDKPHLTVKRTVEEMEEAGWQRISAPKAGSILVWELLTFDDGSQNKHVGFSTEGNRAISTDLQAGVVVEHELPADRNVEAAFWHPRFDTPTDPAL